MNKEYKQYVEDNAFGWQVNTPVFVKTPFRAFGKEWKSGEEFNWQVQPCRTEDLFKMKKDVNSLYSRKLIHHDSSSEIEQKIGDRLGELNTEKLISLVRQMNVIVKKRTTTEKEFQDKRIKQSKIPEKQRGIIRAWLNRNSWALEEYYPIRDNLLSSPKPVEPVESENA